MEQYKQALILILTATSPNDIQQSQLPATIKEELSILQRYFYDIKLHPSTDSNSGEKIYELSEERFAQMQEAMFREDASLRTTQHISYAASLELRSIFCPPEKQELNADEVATELFRCRASNFYLESLGLTINSKSNYIADYYQEDYIKIRKYIKYCHDILTNQEYLWDTQSIFSTFLLHENVDYNPEIEIARANNRLQSHLNKLIINAIKKSWSIQNLRKLITNIDELILAISSANPDHELLHIDNLLPYINSLSDLILALKHIGNFDKQYELLRACPLLFAVNISQNIKTVEQLKSLLAVISPANNKARTLIFNAFPIETLARLAKSAFNLNFLLRSFNNDCRNRLLKKNALYCGSLITNDDDLYLLLDKIHINHLISLVYYIPLEIKVTLLKDLNTLSRVLNLEDTKIASNLIRLLPSMTRLQSLHNSQEKDKVSFFRSVSQSGLQILFASLSASEWYTIFPDRSHIINLISRLEESKQKFVSCIPNHVKMRIYQETNTHRNKVQTNTKSNFNDFNNLKSLVNRLINPPSTCSFLCFWKKTQKTFPDINNISELQVLIIDHYLMNPTKFNLNLAQRICEEYRTGQPHPNGHKVMPVNMKIV